MSRKPLRRSKASRKSASASRSLMNKSASYSLDNVRLLAKGGGLGFRASYGEDISKEQRSLKIARSFSKASHTYHKDAKVQEMMALKLTELMLESELLKDEHYGRVLEVGCGSGKLTRHLINRFNIHELSLNDLSPNMLEAAYNCIKNETFYKNESSGLFVSKDASVANAYDKGAYESGASNNALLGYELLLSKAAKEGECTGAGAGAEVSFASDELRVRLYKGDILESNLESFQKPFDLIVSNAVMQWMPDFKEALEHFRSLATYHSKWFKLQEAGAFEEKVVGNYAYDEPLAPEGVKPSAVAFASLSKGTFIEIKKLLGISLDYMDVDRISEGLGEICSDFDVKFTTHRQYFDSARSMLRHLKDTGVNALSQDAMSVSQMRAFMQSYERYFSDANGVYLTWCPYYVIARF